MARDRKRAKTRRRGGRDVAAERVDQTRDPLAPEADQTRTRDPLAPEARTTTIAPEPLDEASGDAEQAKAAVEGHPPEAVEDRPLGPKDLPHPDELRGEAEADDDSQAQLDEEDAELDERPRAPARRRATRESVGSRAAGAPARPAGPRPRDLDDVGHRREGEGLRVAIFLRSCWEELQRVQWPDRRQVAQATGVVLAFVVIAGGYLGLIDAVVSRLVNLVI